VKAGEQLSKKKKSLLLDAQLFCHKHQIDPRFTTTREGRRDDADAT
jgi:hypothetical protein